nr:DNA gyrase subunit A [Parvularcula oceani]
MADDDNTPETEAVDGDGVDPAEGTAPENMMPPPLPPGASTISITDEMERSYLDYAMSVIVSRAIPDARDGLKPVHRRILWSMHENKYTHDKPYKKSARVVGDVIGKYHPHGDSAVYDALVRMAQDFSLRLPLLDGQGNFGSIDNDPPAAMRYTEVRMAKSATALLADIDQETVDKQDNYDGSEAEPVVLPARFPNLLVNGGGGIAVGMATNIPPHNLGEVVDATIALIDDPQIADSELIEIVPGPDFPTGAQILGQSGARQGLLTGRGSVVMRGVTAIEEVRKDRQAIIITEIPYQVNKSAMVEKIASLVREKRIEGISDLRDESDRQGIRVVVELKRDANPEVVLNNLYKQSQLQTSFGVNMLALNQGRPEQMTLRTVLEAFVRFREEVVTRRTKYELAKARDRAHVLVGLAIAVANIDEVVRLIRSAPNPGAAREALMARDWDAADMAPLVALVADPRSALTEAGTLRLTEVQARAILDLRLQRLTALGRDEIGDELKSLAERIADYLEILRDRNRVLTIIKDELTEVRDEFATPRRSQFIDAIEMEDEDLIAREDMVVTVTHSGYVKRTALDTYRAQRRGGKGRSGMSMKDEDFVAQLFVGNTHTPLLFFTDQGMVYKLKLWRLPEGAPTARGKAFINLLPLSQDERVTNILPLPDDEDEWGRMDILFATRSGGVRRNTLSDFTNVNRAGKIAMKLDEGDVLVGVSLASEANDVLLTTAEGMAIRFPVDNVRVFSGRTSTGVRGIRLADGDHVISMAILHHVDAEPEELRAYLKASAAARRAAGEGETEGSDADEEGAAAALSPERLAEFGAREQFILAVTENGYGKRSSSYEYRTSNRGGKGIIAIQTTERNGAVAASFPVEDGDEIMLVTDGGQLIRTPIADIRVAGRNTQGVTILNTRKGERVVSVEHVPEAEANEALDEAGDAPEQDKGGAAS